MLLYLRVYFCHQTYQILRKTQIIGKTIKTTNSITKLPNRNFLMTSTFTSRYLETIKEVMLEICLEVMLESYVRLGLTKGRL